MRSWKERISFARSSAYLFHTVSLLQAPYSVVRTGERTMRPYRQPQASATVFQKTSHTGTAEQRLFGEERPGLACVRLMRRLYVALSALQLYGLRTLSHRQLPPFQPHRAATTSGRPVYPIHRHSPDSRCEAFESLKIYFSYKCHCTVKWMSHFSNLYFNLSVSKFEGLKFKVFRRKRTGRKKFKIFSFPICEFPICL